MSDIKNFDFTPDELLRLAALMGAFMTNDPNFASLHEEEERNAEIGNGEVLRGFNLIFAVEGT